MRDWFAGQLVQAMVRPLGDVLRVDVGSKQAASASLDALVRRAEPRTILVTEAAAPLLERRFDLERVVSPSGERGSAYRLVRR